MPTYQYECASCGHSFDVLQSMTDARLKKCPKCSKLKLFRLIGTGTGVIFKGSGFYQTDYKKTVQTDSKAQTPTQAKPEISGKNSGKDKKTGPKSE